MKSQSVSLSCWSQSIVTLVFLTSAERPFSPMIALTASLIDCCLNTRALRLRISLWPKSYARTPSEIPPWPKSASIATTWPSNTVVMGSWSSRAPVLTTSSVPILNGWLSTSWVAWTLS